MARCTLFLDNGPQCHYFKTEKKKKEMGTSWLNCFKMALASCKEGESLDT